LKAIAYRYAEIKLAEKRDGEISNPAAFKNARYAEALEMKACAKYAREYTLGCPVDVLAQALAGNNYSLRYQEEHRVAS